MRIDHTLKRVCIPALFLTLSVLSITLLTSLRPVSAVPTGSNFDHVVFIAMENQHYADVMGTGLGSTNAPFITSLLPYGATIPHYHGYGANGRTITGCSAGCYTAVISGSDQGISDGYSCCINAPTLMDTFATQGLTWVAYCEAGCPRGNDHFPFTGFQSIYNSPNIYHGSTVSTTDFITAANSASPPNFLWYTPTDNHNMHDNSIQTGDAYLQSFLVGTGTVTSPAAGSLLASKLFQPGQRTLLVLWWDEYDPSPILFYGTMTKQAFISTSNSFDHFSTLRMLEDNWGLNTLRSNDAAATGLKAEIIGATGPNFTLSATSISGITVGQSAASTITVTAQNGFTGTVTLNDAIPSSLTCGSITPNSVAGSGKATVSCSATAAGSFIVTITGTNGTLIRTATATFNVGTQAAPVLYVPSTETVNELTALSFSVNATDASVPAPTLTLTASHLPSGATFGTSPATPPISGTFAWTPTEAQAPATFTLRFNVTDGVTISQGLVVLTVIEPGTPPTLATPDSQIATVGKTLAFTVTATDPLVPGDPVTLTATGLAPNMAFDPASGAFTFTASQNQAGQSFTVNFIATYSDNPSASSTRSTTLHVQNGSRQPPAGGICLSCLLPNGLSTSAWLLVIGALIGIISTIAILDLRAHSRLTRARNKSHSE